MNNRRINIPFGGMSGSRARAREPLNYELNEEKMKDGFFKREAKIMLWMTLAVPAIGVVAAIVIPHLAKYRESNLPFEELMKRGQQYSAEGNTKKAIKTFKQAIEQKPDNSGAHEALGNAYYQEMEIIYRRSATNAKEWEQIKGQGSELRDLGVEEYRKALQKDKDNWKIRYRVAVELFNQKKYKEAIPEFQQTIQSNPKYAVAYSVLASSYLGVGQYTLALNNIELAHNLDKDDEHYYFNLGKAYYFMKDPSKGFEMEAKLKGMKSDYYQQLLDYRFSHNKEP